MIHQQPPPVQSLFNKQKTDELQTLKKITINTFNKKKDETIRKQHPKTNDKILMLLCINMAQVIPRT